MALMGIKHIILFIIGSGLLPSGIVAQSVAVAPFPLQTCSILAGTSCPGTGQCCVLECCGSGCCGLTDTCINKGTAEAACCDVRDPTRCGTASTSSAASSSVCNSPLPLPANAYGTSLPEQQSVYITALIPTTISGHASSGRLARFIITISRDA
jgi:hypothetical protein